VSDTARDRDAVRCLLEPRSIAVVGASARAGGFGERMVGEVLRSTADVDVHLVNPRYDEIAGRRCVASLDDLPEPVDLVLLGVGDAALETELTRAAERGDRAAVIFGNAYAASAGARAPLRDRLSRIATDASMAVCGGGCMGFVNVVHGIRAIGYAEPAVLPVGPVGLVTHSGSVFSAMLRARRRVGYTVAVSSGQELVTTTASYLDFMLSIPQTRVIALVLEAIRDADRLRESLTTAAARDVPVVLLPVGISERGRSMVAAHSGAVAGGSAAWEALADAHGVHLVSDLGELLDAVELFSAGRRARPRDSDLARASGVGAVLDSGAERALLVDVAADVGLAFAEISERTTAALSEQLDPGLIAMNPLDVWGNGTDTDGLFTGVLTTMSADPAVQAVALAVDMVTEYDGDDSYPRAVQAAAAATDLPVVVLSHLPAAIDEQWAAELRSAGVPVLEGTRSGAVALRHLLAQADQPPAPVAAEIDAVRRARWRDRIARGPLSALDGFEMLRDYGVDTAASRAAADENGALTAAASIGFPVVLKTDEQAVHKTDVGGVVPGLADSAELAVAYREMATRLGPRVVVSQHVTTGVELFLGAVTDPALGPLLLVGPGGLLVEVVGDRAAALPPVDMSRALALLGRTAAERMLLEPRGHKAADIDAVARAIVGFATLLVEVGDAVEAVEVNPLICGPDGAVAVDVHVERRALRRARR
jgi:acyl-CoA synthetase (NDP forming)